MLAKSSLGLDPNPTHKTREMLNVRSKKDRHIKRLKIGEMFRKLTC